jgi:hypothetical protein
MSHNDLKIYIVNSIAMALSFSNIESALKIILLIASIFYTILKTVEILRNKNNDNKADNI